MAMKQAAAEGFSPKAGANFWNHRRREALTGWLFLGPELLGILVLYVFPVFFSLYLSLCDWNLVGGISAMKFVGLDNYAELFRDAKVGAALRNNLVYTLLTVPLGMFLALLLSVVIHSKVYLQSYFKVAFFIPYISSIIAVGAVWSALYHPSLGPINQFLMSIGIGQPPMWLADPNYSLISIAIIAVWAGIGYQIVIYLAGLSGIPDELYEAAEIDGASKLQQFRRITLPLLGPTNSFLFITLLMGSFKVFDLVAFLTGGGPNNASTVIVYRIYEEGFQNFRMGYASAISWLLFAIVGVITFISWQIQKRSVHY
ncbi:carbohydrate ABC transporter permease [Paenibacillus mucilaginosus]|uniref:Binding-protein-dependent transport systems inner membrane component n=1 Tax=Paenibacillus mucilaginosus (strain KNP414) TaxID=1036673 RepID=F8FC05_PAEMK|nr:sugar ABC transporter permease [Paenibacillus mucilaginosus]AEI43766.1 binding-protein-dependent transport systems inner membrane component [Paenibacillus mucilaginosus KNP414]MCG7212710.1 sugar ABC transporter permease [Paenibacillus mucilaginosus]WDM25274.1 sugar ABC transporter permease [Paenibacillus mucilaginosus]